MLSTSRAILLCFPHINSCTVILKHVLWSLRFALVRVTLVSICRRDFYDEVRPRSTINVVEVSDLSEWEISDLKKINSIVV